MSGRPRDEITIDACKAGHRYRWVYSWQQVNGDAWQLRSYRQTTVADCKTSADAPLPAEAGAKAWES